MTYVSDFIDVEQLKCLSKSIRTNSDDTFDDRLVLVDDGLDSGDVVVDGFNGGTGIHVEFVTNEKPILLNRCEQNFDKEVCFV